MGRLRWDHSINSAPVDERGKISAPGSLNEGAVIAATEASGGSPLDMVRLLTAHGFEIAAAWYNTTGKRDLAKVKRDLEAAAKAVAVNRRDHRRRYQRPVERHPLSEVGQPVGVAGQQNARAALS